MQFIFDLMVTHMLTQNAKSEREEPTGNTCLYRGPNGRKCPVGALIADEHYTEHLECKSADDREVQCALMSSQEFLTREDLTLFESTGTASRLQQMLNQVQMSHDGNPPSYWAERLRQLAEVFNLGFNPPVAKI